MSKKKHKGRYMRPRPQTAIPQQVKQSPKDIMKDPYFKRWLPIWHNNAMENYPQIKEDFQVDEKGVPHINVCVSSIPPETKANKPAIILGSGPSLDEAAKYLKDWKHDIFAATSNALVAVKWGREPEYICAFDSHWGLFEHLNSYDWKKAVLLTHPYAEPKTIKWWKGKRLYYRRYYEGFEFSEVILPLMYPWIRIGIRVTGCVVNNAISIANFWRYSPLILVGVDFSWKEGWHDRAMQYTLNKDGTWNEIPPNLPTTEEQFAERKQMTKEVDGYYTLKSWISFKDALINIWANTQCQIIDCSDGLIKEFPKMDLKEVIEKQNEDFSHLYSSPEEKKNISNKYFMRKRIMKLG